MAQKILDPLSEPTTSKSAESGANGSTQNGGLSHVDEPPELLAELAEIRRLLEASEVPAARRIARELPLRWPESRQAAKIAKLLGPSKVRVIRGNPPFPDRIQEFAWLRAHAAQYPGNWLALFADRLLAADPDLQTVLDQLKIDPDGENALLHFQPASMYWP
jgi:hypothetical protein